jgi:hypothetical protein
VLDGDGSFDFRPDRGVELAFSSYPRRRLHLDPNNFHFGTAVLNCAASKFSREQRLVELKRLPRRFAGVAIAVAVGTAM